MSLAALHAGASFDQPALLAAARQRAALEDFGDPWFLEPMARYVSAANAEARLTQGGFTAQTEVIVKGLVNRLRMIDDIKRYPEILDERIEVGAIILGLPRTGSTIFQRMLAAAPGMTAIRWFELQHYAPFPDEEPGNPVARRTYAAAMIEGWLRAAPELASIHPLDPDAPDEEILLLGQMFVSTMIEGMTFVPSFARWLDGYDQSQGHADLKTILKYLQWQTPSRRGKRWVLKSPSNLPYLEYAATAFPEALLIMTHRDPIETVPSYISMQSALYKLGADLSETEVASYWFPRLVEWLRRFEEARARIGERRFVDIDYREVARAPIDQALRILARIGIAATSDADNALGEFVAANRREQRPGHVYSLDRFGLDEAQVSDAFAEYRRQYLA